MNPVKGQTLYRLITNFQQVEAWTAFKQEVDPLNRWTLALLETFLSTRFAGQWLKPFILRQTTPLNLFIIFAVANGLIFYFDPPDTLAKIQESQSNTPLLDNDIAIFTRLQKLEINEINNKKLTLQNLRETLTYPQYIYFSQAEAVMDALILVNPNLMPSDKEKRPKKRKSSNIEKYYQEWQLLLKSFDLKPEQVDSDAFQQVKFRIEDEPLWHELYKLFKDK